MGESLVGVLEFGCKMGEQALEQSVSFGRFEHDTLSWEKWSTFPTNKYLDEVEKCSTRGSVAQKKAYFEAHYKKIAARKLKQEEQHDQEKKIESNLTGSEDQVHKDSICSKCEVGLGFGESNCHNTSCGYVRESGVANLTSEMSCTSQNFMNGNELEREETNVIGEMSCRSQNSVNENESEHEVTNMINEMSCTSQNSMNGNELEHEVTNVISETSFTSHNSENVNELENEVDNVLSEMSSTCQSLVNSIEVENEVGNLASEMGSHHLEELNDDDDANVIKEPEHSETSAEVLNTRLEKPLEILLVKGEPSQESQLTEEFVEHKDKGFVNAPTDNEEQVKSETPIRSQKATTVKKATSTASAKKKPDSPMPRKPLSSMMKKTASTTPKKPTSLPQKKVPPILKKPSFVTPKSLSVSTPKFSRPSLPKTSMTPLSDEKTSRIESKREAPKSLHMSLSLGPVDFDPASLTRTRNSSIMETMGDKDIVKRAFKAFQNKFNQRPPSELGKPSAVDQLLEKVETKSSMPDVSRKKNEGITKAVKKASSRTVQQGLRMTSVSTKLLETGVTEQRNANSLSSSFGLWSRASTNKQKVVSKRADERSDAKEAVQTRLVSRVKMTKDNPRAKTIPGIDQRSTMSKSSVK